MAFRKRTNKPVGNALKFATYNLNKIKSYLLSGNLTSEQIAQLNQLKTSLTEQRDSLKVQDRARRLESHVNQALRLVTDFKNSSTRDSLFKDQYPVIGIREITAFTPGVTKAKSNKKKDIF